MVSDDERREAVAAFRRCRKATERDDFASIFDVLEAVGLNYYDGSILYERLADLIEPS